MILANPSPDAAGMGKKNNGNTVRLPMHDGELCLPNACLRPFRKLAKSDPQSAFAGILPKEDWEGEAKKIAEHNNDSAKFRYMTAMRAYLDLLARLEARKQEWQNELQQTKSEEKGIRAAAEAAGERIKQLEKVFSEAHAVFEEVSQKGELDRKTKNFRANIDEVAEKKGVKELVDSLGKTLSSVLGPGDRISITDYSSLIVEIARKEGAETAARKTDVAAIDATYQTTMKFISRMNDYVEVVQDCSQVASLVEDTKHLQDLKDVLEKNSARSDWLEPMLLHGRLSTQLTAQEVAKILKVLEKQSKSANEDVLMGIQSVKQFSDLAGTCSKELGKVRKELQQLDNYIRGLESKPLDKRMWLEGMDYHGTLEYCINDRRGYREKEELLSVLLALVNEARNLLSFLVASQKTALRAASAMLDSAIKLGLERGKLSELSEKLCTLSERKTHLAQLPGLEAAIAKVKGNLEGLQSGLETILEREKLSKRLREERQENHAISFKRRFFELEQVADAQNKNEFAFIAPAKQNEAAEDKTLLQAQKIGEFIKKVNANTLFSKAFGASPQIAKRLKELLERLAETYIKNGGKLHREAMMREFPQLVRDEGIRRGFESDVHIVRLGFDVRAKWRLFINIKNPERPAIMFVGQKHGQNGSDSYLDNKKYSYDDVKAREDGRLDWFPSLLENGTAEEKNGRKVNGGK